MKDQMILFPEWEQDIENSLDWGSAHNAVFVSFSGGKDSVATYLEVINQYPKSIVKLIFADTGDETDDTYDYVRWFHNHIHPVTRLTSRVVRKTSERRRELETVVLSWHDANNIVLTNPEYISVFNEIRYRFEGNRTVAPFPTNGIRFCTKTLKVRAFDRYVGLQVGLDRSLCLVAIGLRRAESSGRANTPRFTVDTDNRWDVWYPIYNYSLSDVWEAHERAGIPRNPTYDYRERSNCIGCPFAGIHEIRKTVQKYGRSSIQGWIDLEAETGFSWCHGVSISSIADGVQLPNEVYSDVQAISCASGFCDT